MDVYRDTSFALDEHDRAVGAILIGEALVQVCDRAWTRSREVETPEPERWRAIASIHDTVPEIWRHLDRARRLLASRGANTATYDEARPLARRAASNPGLDGKEAVDIAALDDAKRAVAELKLALPGADWAAIDARTDGLVTGHMRRRHRQRVAFTAGLVSAVVATMMWLLAIVPGRAPVVRASQHTLTELASARLELEQKQTRLGLETKIQHLRGAIGDQCLPAPVHELMRELVLDGRNAEANAFAQGYTQRCGEDLVVDHWAAAPHPPKKK